MGILAVLGIILIVLALLHYVPLALGLILGILLICVGSVPLVGGGGPGWWRR